MERDIWLATFEARSTLKREKRKAKDKVVHFDDYSVEGFNENLDGESDERKVRIRKFSPLARKVIIWFVLSSIFLVIIIFILFGVL